MLGTGPGFQPFPQPQPTYMYDLSTQRDRDSQERERPYSPEPPLVLGVRARHTRAWPLPMSSPPQPLAPLLYASLSVPLLLLLLLRVADWERNKASDVHLALLGEQLWPEKWHLGLLGIWVFFWLQEGK